MLRCCNGFICIFLERNGSKVHLDVAGVSKASCPYTGPAELGALFLTSRATMSQVTHGSD